MPITLNGDGAISGLTATGISAVQNVPATSVITTLNAPSGVLATQNGMTGIAKAWVTWTGSSGAIVASFNVSSMTQIATGRWRVNFTTAMPNANYCSIGYADLGTDGFCYKQGVNTTTTAEELRFIRTDNGALFTPTTGYFVAFSS